MKVKHQTLLSHMASIVFMFFFAFSGYAGTYNTSACGYNKVDIYNNLTGQKPYYEANALKFLKVNKSTLVGSIAVQPESGSCYGPGSGSKNFFYFNFKYDKNANYLLADIIFQLGHVDDKGNYKWYYNDTMQVKVYVVHDENNPIQVISAGCSDPRLNVNFTSRHPAEHLKYDVWREYPSINDISKVSVPYYASRL